MRLTPLAALAAWIDANYDGAITAADPVWNEFRVWQDANGNGAVEDGEKLALEAQGITRLDYAMGRFTQNGVDKQMASVDLKADTEGTRTNVIDEGILVETSQGHLSLLVNQVDDLTRIEANRDGVVTFEDLETIITTADLLANDSLGGFVSDKLSVTGVGNFTHGVGYLDGNGSDLVLGGDGHALVAKVARSMVAANDATCGRAA